MSNSFHFSVWASIFSHRTHSLILFSLRSSGPLIVKPLACSQFACSLDIIKTRSTARKPSNMHTSFSYCSFTVALWQTFFSYHQLFLRAAPWLPYCSYQVLPRMSQYEINCPPVFDLNGVSVQFTSRSWGFQGILGFTFTTSWNGHSRLPFRDTSDTCQALAAILSSSLVLKPGPCDGKSQVILFAGAETKPLIQ